MLPSVFLPFRSLASGSVVFRALCGRFLDFPGKGCLCLCGGVHLFLENRARLFLPLGLRGGFVPRSWLWSGRGFLWRLRPRWFCRLLVPGRSGAFLLLNGEGTLGDIPFYTTYPRACGGTCGENLLTCSCEGLSPRLRGNLPRSGQWGDQKGSIPAPAGEPVGDSGPHGVPTVYPRACGEPLPSHASNRASRVYPRACGGTSTSRLKAGRKPGLSPRLRGNLQVLPVSFPRFRSIPAPAGEPPAPLRQNPHRAVYPRACGGTTGTSTTKSTQSGLSPRLRGTAPPGPDPQPDPGLSPRLRGNHDKVQARWMWSGSIPAPAGEPELPVAAWTPPRVYPRACGGTSCMSWITPTGSGLSPRLRGNPQHPGREEDHQRSIPAPAGNLACRAGLLWSGRSIPAPAGEPAGPLRYRRRWAVYPRACGGTRL